MVSISSIVFIIISIILCVGFPLAIVIYMYRKYGISWKVLLVGSAAFIISQPILRINILNALNNSVWFNINVMQDYIVYSLFLGITAGIFEETARFICFKFFLKNKYQWKSGIAFGVGHGGIEALIFVLPACINNLIYSLSINGGKFESLLTKSGISSNMISQMKESLINAKSYLFLMSGLERVFTIIFHIAMSLMVLYAVKNRKNIYFLYAILFHALLDSPLGIFKHFGVNPIFIEVYLMIMALISIIVIFKFKNKFKTLEKSDLFVD
ncbi:MAG: YhfC family intramembrane metalloprotease [Clostridium sp.]|uniref:YhfC family intramembrane metalloprotease n=1 Tax=Clostridium sp. TaxID=1506 RepID=UPI003D6D9822